VDDERILVLVPQLNLDGVTRTVGDLVFTTRRVFLANTAGNADLAQAFGVIGAALASQSSRTASQQLQAQPLEKILAAADPRTRFEYPELQGITVTLGSFFSTPAVRFVPREGKRIKLWGKRPALEHLASAVPFLVSAGAPISLS
jgi:hypothetical protein